LRQAPWIAALCLLFSSCDKVQPPASAAKVSALPSLTSLSGGTLVLVPAGPAGQFYIDVHPVTQEIYQKVMGVNPSKQKNPQAPVAGVQWVDAVRFSNKCSEAEGLEPCYDLKTWACDASRSGYRLPTEAEWEVACRAGSTARYPFGDDASQLGRHAWTKSNSEGKVRPVGQKEPNAWGLYDMLGNAWEWCIDGERIYTPACAVDPRGPVGDTAIVRGGSVHPQDTATFYRSAKRFAWSRSVPTTNLTFRVVCEGNINQP